MTFLKRLWNWLIDPICGSCEKKTAARGGVLCTECRTILEQSLKELLKEK